MWKTIYKIFRYGISSISLLVILIISLSIFNLYPSFINPIYNRYILAICIILISFTFLPLLGSFTDQIISLLLTRCPACASKIELIAHFDATDHSPDEQPFLRFDECEWIVHTRALRSILLFLNILIVIYVTIKWDYFLEKGNEFFTPIIIWLIVIFILLILLRN